MKLINLIQIKNVFKPDMKFGDIQVGYKLMKFLKSIENDIIFYNNKLNEIIQECAEKNGDEIKITENGGFKISEDKISEWNSKTIDLANIEVDVNIPSFKLKDFSELNFTLEELSILELLISE